MHTKMIRGTAAALCLVAPYPELLEAARRLAPALAYALAMHLTDLNRVVNELPSLEARGHQLLISRGGCAALLRKHSRLPVVEIRTSGYDVLDALSPFIGQGQRIGIVGFERVVEGCARVAAILGIDHELFLLKDHESGTIEALQRRLAQTHVDCLVGDTVCRDYLGAQPSAYRLLNSSAESLRDALDEAQWLFGTFRQQVLDRDHLQLILDNFEKAVMSVDASGKILHANESVRKLFGLPKPLPDLLTLDELSPSLRVDWHALKLGHPVHAQVIDGPSGPLVLNQHPVTADGELTRAVLTLQTISSLRGTEHHVRRQELAQRGLNARYHFSDIVTANSEMLRRLKILQSYAPTDATVLITGETGTGKELIAQSLHNGSARAAGPFVAINCGAVAPQILESELFGYVAGAFTGAAPKGKAGLFELAHRGTLFLDEVSELDRPLQSRLLRVLQERQVMRLGSDQVIPIDSRVIAATNQKLSEQIERGLFREDLYYRLNVLKVTTIPLRDRPEDIQTIGSKLLDEFCQRYKREPMLLEPALWSHLQSFAWPGNVRQLGNVMERLVLSTTSRPVQLKEALLLIDDLQPLTPTRGACGQCDMLEGDFKTIRSRILRQLLSHDRDNKSKVAKRLNVDRTSLNRWLKEEDKSIFQNGIPTKANAAAPDSTHT